MVLAVVGEQQATTPQVREVVAVVAAGGRRQTPIKMVLIVELGDDAQKVI